MPEDCFWFTKEINGEKFFRAMCENCHQKMPLGWYWNGKNLGYGDYDLNCDLCQKVLNLRPGLTPEEDNAETKVNTKNETNV